MSQACLFQRHAQQEHPEATLYKQAVKAGSLAICWMHDLGLVWFSCETEVRESGRICVSLFLRRVVFCSLLSAFLRCCALSRLSLSPRQPKPAGCAVRRSGAQGCTVGQCKSPRLFVACDGGRRCQTSVCRALSHSGRVVGKSGARTAPARHRQAKHLSLCWCLPGRHFRFSSLVGSCSICSPAHLCIECSTQGERNVNEVRTSSSWMDGSEKLLFTFSSVVAHQPPY